MDKLDEVQAALDSEDTDFEVMMSDKCGPCWLQLGLGATCSPLLCAAGGS